MKTLRDAIDTWPTHLTGRPALKSTNDAIVYATLIYNYPDYVQELKLDDFQNFTQIGTVRQTQPLDFTKLSALAIQGQYLRECLQEVLRLKDMSYQLKPLEGFSVTKPI